MIRQSMLTLDARPRGFHLITSEVRQALPDLSGVRAGLLHVFIQHTSASLTINENASPDVRSDMEDHFDEMVPENQPYYDHTIEGSDDMPAHIKASLLDTSLTIPIRDGELALGTWQGIYLNEHRDHGGRRSLVLTITGSTGDETAT
ncbi:secondary thiamine-phosphate synthase enzyme YjbQ [Longibacter sp.]|uniref:secondary thiamine-phosphate synthase enzyme YjbQ n=1 Tax=Longibacter sp. TaxID=2045415 RepID=UPI003EBF39E2